MLNAAIILSSLLTSTPPPTVEAGSDSTRVLAYDSDGEVAAELVMRRGNGAIRLDASFPDGASLNVVIDEAALASGDARDVAVECVDCVSAQVQLAAVQDILHDVDPQASWLKCAGYAALTAEEIIRVSPFAIAAAVLAACECIPEIVDEFEGMECF